MDNHFLQVTGVQRVCVEFSMIFLRLPKGVKREFDKCHLKASLKPSFIFLPSKLDVKIFVGKVFMHLLE